MSAPCTGPLSRSMQHFLPPSDDPPVASCPAEQAAAGAERTTGQRHRPTWTNRIRSEGEQPHTPNPVRRAELSFKDESLGTAFPLTSNEAKPSNHGRTGQDSLRVGLRTYLIRKVPATYSLGQEP